MRAALVLLVGVWMTAVAGCAGDSTPPPFRPVADTRLLMESVVVPNATVLWDAVGTIVDETGVHDVQPSTPEEWAAVRNSAVGLAESGNLLMMVPRALDGAEWMDWSRALVDAGELAMRAIEARDADELLAAGSTVYDVCTNCHETYAPDVNEP